MPKFPIEVTYLNIAKEVAKRSYSTRKQVGAVLVSASNDQILSYGWNGMPKGFDNTCEDASGKTNDLVLHAEANAILKCAKEGKVTKDSILYMTMSPCVHCTKLIIQAGVSAVVYLEEYRETEGLKILKKSGISCTYFDEKKKHFLSFKGS